MSKRIFSLILAAVMVFSLLPVFASAEGEDPNAIAEEKTNLSPGEMTTDSMVTNKYLTRNGDAYDLTMSAYATGGTMTQELESDVPLDIVLVLDQSGSMLDTDMASTSDYVSAGNKAWTVSDAMGYYVKDGNNYYQLSADRGYTYTSSVHPYLTDSLLGTTGGEDWHTNWETHSPNYYVMDSNGNLCQLYSRSIGYVGGYDCQFYYYPQGNSSAVYIPFNSASGSTTASYSRSTLSFGTGSMNSNSNRLWTTVYKPSSSQTYNHLYYTKDDQKVYLGSEVNSSNQTAYIGELFYYSSRTQSRLEALKDAAKQFVGTVAERSAATGADHRIAVVGFSGNRPNLFSSNFNHIIENNGVDTNRFNFTNTGVFVDGVFKNFKTLKPYTELGTAEDGDLLSNGVYCLRFEGAFRNGSPTTNNSAYEANDLVGVFLNGKSVYSAVHADRATGQTSERRLYKSNGYYYYIDGDTRYYFYGTVYAASFTSLTNPDDYQNALEHVNVALKPEGDASVDSNTNGINDYIDYALDHVDAYGATYVSYGMAMANQIFKNNPAVTADGTERKRIVVVFTDGKPGPGTEANPFDESVAGESVLDAATAKSVYNASVYTVALFPAANELDGQTQTFLENLSSRKYNTTSNVYVEEFDPAKTYYYYDEAGDQKTYAVKAMDTYTYFYWHDENGGFRIIQSRNVSYIKRAEDNSSVQYYADLVRGDKYHIYEPAAKKWIYNVDYDYIWLDSNGLAVEPILKENAPPEDYKYQFMEANDPVDNL